MKFSHVQPVERRGGVFLMTMSNHDTRCLHRRVTDQGLHGPAKHRFAAKHSILLGDAAAEALAFSGSDDEGGGGHRAARLGLLALSAKGSSLI